MTPTQIRVGSPFGRRIAEVTPAFDDLFRRASADAELEPAVADEIGRTRVLDHVERILVSHVDDGRSDLDATRPGADGREQRKGRPELPGKVMHAKVRAVGAELLGRHSELDRLLKHIARRSRDRWARRCPMTEGQESDLFHCVPCRCSDTRAAAARPSCTVTSCCAPSSTNGIAGVSSSLPSTLMATAAAMSSVTCTAMMYRVRP